MSIPSKFSSTDHDFLLSIQEAHRTKVTDSGKLRKMPTDASDELASLMELSQIDPFMLDAVNNEDSANNDAKRVKTSPDSSQLEETPKPSQSPPLPSPSLLSLLKDKV